MKLDKKTIDQLAEHLENAERGANEVTKYTNDYPDMEWEEA